MSNIKTKIKKCRKKSNQCFLDIMLKINGVKYVIMQSAPETKKKMYIFFFILRALGTPH